MLGFWTNRNAARVNILFRQSALMRDKWRRDDYRTRTLRAALG
jgi:primase-polymerase (primpol)-like protein